VATGSKPLIPDIPGIEKAASADDVLLGKSTVGRKTVIIGGGLEGLDTALYLAEQGKQVVIVKRYPEVGTHLDATTKMSFIKEPGGLISKYKIDIITEASVLEVNERGVELVDKLGNRTFIEADSVVYARGRQSLIDHKLRECVNEVYVIGDARQPRKIIDAIHEGFMTALGI
jgi:2-enoate reductase